MVEESLLILKIATMKGECTMGRKPKRRNGVNVHVNKYEGYAQKDKDPVKSKTYSKSYEDYSMNTSDSSVVEDKDLGKDVIESEVVKFEEEVKTEEDVVDETIDFWSESRQVTEMGVSQRIRRGMVFWYDIRPDVDKTSVHRVCNGKYVDYVQYGRRPWVVVSSDEMNRKNTLVSICPMSSGKAGSASYNSAHVDLLFMGRKTSVLCEQVRSVTAAELVEYMSTLSNSMMDKIDDAIMYHLGLTMKPKFTGTSVSDAMSKIESIINSMVADKLAQLPPVQASQKDIDDMVQRISNSFENAYSNKIRTIEPIIPNNKSTVDNTDNSDDKSVKSQVDKFYSKYPELKLQVESVEAKKNIEKIEKPEEVPVEVKKEKKENKPVKRVLPSAPLKKEKEEVKSNIVLPSPGPSDKRLYVQWDVDTMKRFINDCNSHDIKDVTERWGFGTRVKCMKKRAYVLSKLTQLGEVVDGSYTESFKS